MPSKTHKILFVKISHVVSRRLRTEPSLVTGCGEVRGRDTGLKQLIVSKKRGNACGGKGLVVGPLGQGHIHRTKRRVKDGRKTGLITYPVNRAVLLKSQIGKTSSQVLVRGSYEFYSANSGLPKRRRLS